MQHSNKKEKIVTGKRAAWGEAVTKKGDNATNGRAAVVKTELGRIE